MSRLPSPLSLTQFLIPILVVLAAQAQALQPPSGGIEAITPATTAPVTPAQAGTSGEGYLYNDAHFHLNNYVQRGA